MDESLIGSRIRRRHSRKGVRNMSLDQATELVRQALILALIIAAPMLLVGLLVGTVLSLVQAMTQVQEQTLTFFPKIVAMVAVTILLLPWIGQRLVEYAASMFASGLKM